MSAKSPSPHKPTGPTKPDRCPECGQPYAFRCRQRDDVFRWNAGFRCRHRGRVYLHEGAEHPTGVLSL